MRIGIDLGGTKIEGIGLSPDGAILVRRRVPTPKAYKATLEALAEVVEAIESAIKERGTVGIGIPGTVMPATGLVKNAISVALY